MQPGELFLQEGDIVINQGKTVYTVTATNTGDRPIQVGSHYHFYEVNEAMKFNRDETLGKRLNIPAGAAVRFEPGDEKEVELICFSGEQQVYGFNNKVDGPIKGGCK